MKEIKQVNQCDTRCPLGVYKHAVYRQRAAGASLLQQAGLVVSHSVEGLGQIQRSVNCPMGHLAVQDWRPDPACEAEVQQGLTRHPLDPRQFTEHEQAILGPYLPQDPPAAEITGSV